MQTVDSPVKNYLRSIGKYPLLSAEQEKELGGLVQSGIQAQRSLDEQPGLTRREQIALRKQVSAGQAAYTQFLCSNLRLVVHYIKRYRRQDEDFMDLVQAGNIGLHTAVLKFDPARGYKFSTYASWWIRQALTRQLETENDLIHIPAQLRAVEQQVAWTRDALQTQLGDAPTDEEIALHGGHSMAEIEQARQVPAQPISFSILVSDSADSGLTLGDNIPDPGSVEDKVVASMTRLDVANLLDGLDPDERAVIEARYWPGSKKIPKSRKTVALHYRALEKLRKAISEEDRHQWLEALRA